MKGQVNLGVLAGQAQLYVPRGEPYLLPGLKWPARHRLSSSCGTLPSEGGDVHRPRSSHSPGTSDLLTECLTVSQTNGTKGAGNRVRTGRA